MKQKRRRLQTKPNGAQLLDTRCIWKYVSIFLELDNGSTLTEIESANVFTEIAFLETGNKNSDLKVLHQSSYDYEKEDVNQHYNLMAKSMGYSNTSGGCFGCF